MTIPCALHGFESDPFGSYRIESSRLLAYAPHASLSPSRRIESNFLIFYRMRHVSERIGSESAARSAASPPTQEHE